MEPCFHIVLKEERLDVEALANKLGRDPAIVQAPNPEAPTFIVCSSPETARLLRADLKENPDTPNRVNGVLTLRPTYLTVWQYSPQEIVEKIRDFILPLVRDRDFRIVSEFNVDVTDRYKDDPTLLFRE